MGFFDTLRRVLAGDSKHAAPADAPASPADALVTEATPAPELGTASAYDRSQWHKKLKRILNELPDSQPEWADLIAEAKALELDAEWVARCQLDEFLLMIRRAVSDRVVTESEHRKLDQARTLIGISEEEAEAALNTIAAEAASFFGKPVRDG